MFPTAPVTGAGSNNPTQPAPGGEKTEQIKKNQNTFNNDGSLKNGVELSSTTKLKFESNPQKIKEQYKKE